MRYAPPIYKECCHCQSMITIRPRVEANARTAVRWTDGFVDSPIKCNACGEFIWLNELLMHANNDPKQTKDYRALQEDDHWMQFDPPPTQTGSVASR